MVSGIAGFFIAVVVVALFVVIIYVGHTQLRARKLGLPPPNISSYNPFQTSSNLNPYAAHSGDGGPISWIKQKVSAFKNRNSRSTTGGYENTRHIDDNIWDARNDYNYDVELENPCLQQNTTYNVGVNGSSYNMNLASTPSASRSDLDPDADEPRGRSRSREPGPETSRANPFGDDAPSSNMPTTNLGPSGRPPQDAARYDGASIPRPTNSSPERRSIFREEM